MLAETANFSPPLEMAAWLASAAFLIWFLLLLDKAIQRVRGQPPASDLEAMQVDLKRRVKALEEWRLLILAKMDADKREILEAGEKREIKLTNELRNATGRIDDLQKTVANLPAEFLALLANARNILGGKS
jgi:hypothetical protein